MLPRTSRDSLAAAVRAGRLVAAADALVIGAGAGMSADSGLPVYYGPDGRYGNNLIEKANAEWFINEPSEAAAWAAREVAAVQAAVPHQGYEILNEWAAQARYGACVYTSNVDGFFEQAGFTKQAGLPVYEVHGNRAWSQCLQRCGAGVFPTAVDGGGVARCPRCGAIARPNTLLFGDYEFDDTRRGEQWIDLGAWFDQLPEDANVVVLELGAGTTVPTVRRKCETFALTYEWPLVRVNLAEPDCLSPMPPEVYETVQMTCEDALLHMDVVLDALGH